MKFPDVCTNQRLGAASSIGPNFPSYHPFPKRLSGLGIGAASESHPAKERRPSCRPIGGGTTHRDYSIDTERKGKRRMPALSESTYPQGPVLQDGYYPATLKEVTEYTKTYEGRETVRLAWIFDVEAEEDAVDDTVEIEDAEYAFSGTFEIAAHTGAKKSTKANSNWSKLDMDVIVPEGCTDTDDVIGAKCIVNVSSFVAEDGLTKNTIEKIRPPKKGKGSTRQTTQMKAEAETEAANDEDFDQLNL